MTFFRFGIILIEQILTAFVLIREGKSMGTGQRQDFSLKFASRKDMEVQV